MGWDQLFGTMGVRPAVLGPSFGTTCLGPWDHDGTQFGTMRVWDHGLGPSFGIMGVWGRAFGIMRVWDHGCLGPTTRVCDQLRGTSCLG